MQVIILCGGKGLRGYPHTQYLPKGMWKINRKPIIEHIINIYVDQGFTSFILALGHQKDIYIDYFQGKFPNLHIDLVDTGKDADTGERIERCKEFIQDVFFATYADGLSDIRLHDLLSFHNSNPVRAATVSSVPLRSQYGILSFDAHARVTGFREKPVIEKYWINAGFFVFDKSVFDHWQGGSLEREVLPHLAELGLLYVYRHYGFWRSIDTYKDLREIKRICEKGPCPWIH